MEEITIGEAAKRWGVSPAAVRKYVSRGMAFTSAGLLLWPACDEWRRMFNAPERSGNFRARQTARRGVTPKAPQLPSLRSTASAVDLLRALHGPGLVKLTRIAKALGFAPVMRNALVHIACSWLWDTAGDALIFACDPDKGPAVDYTGLRGESLAKAENAQADAWIECANRALKTKGRTK